MHTLAYSNAQGTITCNGLRSANGEEFNTFLVEEVSARLNDEEEAVDFRSLLNSLASTEFAQQNLRAILEVEHPEERAWAVGEALAEAWIIREHGVLLPWNMARDKRTSQASLPGADLVGFLIQEGKTRLVLGEVKSSSESKTPPQVMTSREGMSHQLEKLATDLNLLFTLLRWLSPRCLNSDFEPHFKAATALLLESGHKAISLFGVLIRDTQPDGKDLHRCGQHLGNIVQAPASCHLLALYIPCLISTLSDRIQAGGAV